MKAYPATLRKTDGSVEYVGDFFWYPKVGDSFIFNIQAYKGDTERNDPATLRTSTVRSVRFVEGKHTFTTLNSVYELVETSAITPVTYFRKPVTVRASGVEKVEFTPIDVPVDDL